MSSVEVDRTTGCSLKHHLDGSPGPALRDVIGEALVNFVLEITFTVINVTNGIINNIWKPFQILQIIIFLLEELIPNISTLSSRKENLWQHHKTKIKIG